MRLKQIVISFCYAAVPVLVVAGLTLFLCSCTKKNSVVPAAAIAPTATPDTDTMLNNGLKTYLALGDSYTIGTSVSDTDRYPVQTAALLKAAGIDIAGADIIAANGWTTDDLINGINSRAPAAGYGAVSLLIGVNNQYQGRGLDEYRTQFTLLVQRAIQLANGQPGHVIVISIPDYSVTPFALNSNRPKIAAEIDAYNNVNKTIAGEYNVQYLYITDESRKAAADPSLVAADGLHFSGKEYAVWSGRLAPMIQQLLK